MLRLCLAYDGISEWQMLRLSIMYKECWKHTFQVSVLLRSCNRAVGVSGVSKIIRCIIILTMNCLLLLNLLTVVLLHLPGEAGAAPSRNASMCATPPPMMLTQCLRMVYNGCRSVNCCQPHCLQDCSNNREVTRNSIIMACLSESIQNPLHCIVDIQCNVSSTETTLSSECISAYQILCQKLPRNHSPATNTLVSSCRQICIATSGSNSTSRLPPMTCRRVNRVYCRSPSNREECAQKCAEDDNCVCSVSDTTIILLLLHVCLL